MDKYSKDKFCTFDFTLSAMGDLMKLIIKCNINGWYSGISKSLPLFLIAGNDDPVGNYAVGVKSVYDKLISSNHNVKLKLYENCRHEILNDSSKEEVIKDILEFLNK